MDLTGFIIESLIKILLVFGATMLGVLVMILAERRLSAFIQDRLGPNRVGPGGILQPLADGLKFLFKEDIIPAHVDKVIYVAAPALILVPALITFAVIPFGNEAQIFGRSVKLQIADVNIGVLYILAITSLGVYGIVLGSWASNNKYSLLGGLRASAQMISYELSLSLSLIGVLMLCGSLRLNQVLESQETWYSWNVFKQPLGFLIFTVAAFAETNRLPFDLAEAEQELVAGYHTEYSSMKFAMFFMAEYANMITSSALIATLFFGGYRLFGLENLHWIIQPLILIAKMAFFLFLFIWIRWTLPRFRYDQLMMLGWKILLPLAFLNVFITGILLTI